MGLYLLTKGIAAGSALLAPWVGVLGVRGFAADWLPEIRAFGERVLPRLDCRNNWDTETMGNLRALRSLRGKLTRLVDDHRPHGREQEVDHEL